MKMFIIIVLILSLLVSCATQQKENPQQTPTETISTGSPQPTPTETVPNGNPSPPDVVKEPEYIYIFSNQDYFFSIKGEGVEIKYDAWQDYGFFPYDNLDYSINKTIYKNGLGMDGQFDDGYDNRGYGADTYEVLQGKYDNISGIFGYDDKSPIKLKSHLVIFIDGKEHHRAEINEKTPFVNISVDIPIVTKEIKFRFEVKDKIEQFMPALLFVDAKARKVE